ncbi:MAG: hypothetical protein RBG1_1C00001G0800 [candidate division Zixibacteria bacterium RBG-1]|nr:MAG: hypothetical protein RBG1_1C00001G0800 [candidate division Zixibacteria bacterium RBG-1]OGC86416.1 MAG: hypothetical protein A2V73_03020 [candidate division Zixibacteria bacterium RBG_19FT_COMBO_42_43]
MPKFILISIIVLSLQSWSSVNLEAVAQEEVPVLGYKIKVDYIRVEEEKGKKKEKKKKVQGELLAVSSDTLYVLSYDWLFAIEKASVRKVEVELSPSISGGLWVWTLVGTASTLSHGYFLFASAPVWLLVGSVTAASASSKSSKLKLREAELQFQWEDLRRFARYPQGLPPNFQPPK